MKSSSWMSAMRVSLSISPVTARVAAAGPESTSRRRTRTACRHARARPWRTRAPATRRTAQRSPPRTGRPARSRCRHPPTPVRWPAGSARPVLDHRRGPEQQHQRDRRLHRSGAHQHGTHEARQHRFARLGRSRIARAVAPPGQWDEHRCRGRTGNAPPPQVDWFFGFSSAWMGSMTRAAAVCARLRIAV